MSELLKATVVVGVMPFRSDTNPLLTAVTVPVMLAVPPGLEMNPTKENPPQLTTGMQAAHKMMILRDTNGTSPAAQV